MINVNDNKITQNPEITIAADTATSSVLQPPVTEFNTEMGVEDATVKLNNYYSQMIDSLDHDNSSVLMDHCYSRPWNWRPETNFLRPTKTLFISKPNINKNKSTNPLAPMQEVEDVLDVERYSPEPPAIYDTTKAKSLMDECERHATFARVDQGNEDWEHTINKTNWTSEQFRLFNGVANILNSDHLARLAYNGSHYEAVLRRAVVDKSVKRIRRLLASISWDVRLIQWLHQLLIDNLSTQYLGAYLDILQTLKSKLPTFVDKMMFGPNSTGKMGVLSNESLFSLLKRPWDPVAASLMQDKPKRLPGNPIIVIVPSAPVLQGSGQSKRLHKWIMLLSNLATVVTVTTNIGSSGSRMTMMNCIDQMLSATRGKLQELRTDYPGRNIILAGFNSGASLALQVAQLEPVLCVLCLGFSLLTAEGRRGEPDDNLLELQCPVMFVIGQCSNTALQEDMEDLRERMRVETELIVVGSADDYLRISKKKKCNEGITQSVVDRFIVDEVGEFVSGLLLSPGPPQLRQSPVHISPDTASVKRNKIERNRHNSNGSSIDSEPPSPTTRIARPVGRPPGSKSKAKLDAKWASQIAQGTTLHNSSPSDSPPPSITTPITPDTSSTDSNPLIDRPHSNSAAPPPFDASNKSFRPLPSIGTGVDKIKKPPTPSMSPQKPNTSNAAKKLHSMGLTNRTVLTGSTLSHLLQGTYKGSPGKSGTSGIRVLENVTLSAAGSAKLLSSSGKPLDLSKITVLNTVNSPKPGASMGNVLLMPDGKLKTIPPMKSAGTITTFSSTNPSISSTTQTQPPSSTTATKSRMTKYITSKKQLLGNRRTKPKKVPYIPPVVQTSLPPPTNLTSQDIMDLPIIFADDNQLLTESGAMQPELVTGPPAPPCPIPIKTPTSSATSKLIFVNKHIPIHNSGNVIISQSNIKKIPATVPLKNPSNAIKYTKIILSKRPTSDESRSCNVMSKISNLSSEISVKKIQPVQSENEPIDLENELVATAVPKPNCPKSDIKSVTVISKKSDSTRPELPQPLQTILNEALAKRSAELAELNVDDDKDPDYIPPKNMKLS